MTLPCYISYYFALFIVQRRAYEFELHAQNFLSIGNAMSILYCFKNGPLRQESFENIKVCPLPSKTGSSTMTISALRDGANRQDLASPFGLQLEIETEKRHDHKKPAMKFAIKIVDMQSEISERSVLRITKWLWAQIPIQRESMYAADKKASLGHSKLLWSLWHRKFWRSRHASGARFEELLRWRRFPDPLCTGNSNAIIKELSR